jgi:hypothetical protein
MLNYKTFETNENRGKTSWKRLRELSDNLCREYSLSVLTETELSGERGQSHYEYTQNSGGSSWKPRLKIVINSCVCEAENFDGFLKKMREAGALVEYRPENKIRLKYKLPGQQKFTRARTLGTPYDVDGICERIERYRRFLEGANIYVPRIPLIDTETEKMQEAEALAAWARVRNMKTAAEIMLKLEKKGVPNLSALGGRIEAEKGKRKEYIEKKNALKKELSEFEFLQENIDSYRAGKPVSAELNELRAKPFGQKKAAVFAAENAEKLKDFERAREALKGYKFEGNRLPDGAKIKAKIERIGAEIAELDGKIKTVSGTAGEFEAMREALNKYLQRDEPARERSREKGRDTPEKDGFNIE